MHLRAWLLVSYFSCFSLYIFFSEQCQHGSQPEKLPLCPYSTSCPSSSSWPSSVCAFLCALLCPERVASGKCQRGRRLQLSAAQLPLQLIENTKFPLSRRQIIWQLLERACLAFILKLITLAEILHKNFCESHKQWGHCRAALIFIQMHTRMRVLFLFNFTPARGSKELPLIPPRKD